MTDSQPIDRAELDLISVSLRHVLDTNEPARVADALLCEGWAELCTTAPAEAITALAEQAGAARSAAPVLDLAVLWGAGIEPDGSTAVIHGDLVLAGAGRATRFVVASAGGLRVVPAQAVELTEVRGFDPALGLSRAAVLAGAGEPAGGSEVAEQAIAAGRRALASQMVGAAEQMLTDTLAYVIERHQYGRAIGSFQTVKHRLADVRVAYSAARAATAAAWEAVASTDATITAMAAKVLAGRAHELASTHCFQVHGGIAFTVEHGFQQWVRRGMLLDHLLGDHEQLTTDVGRHVIARRHVPRVPALKSRGG
jgi:alkylation response protein AidB-like acyl-CoA dehydrogenase